MQNNAGCTLNLHREDMKQVTKHWVNSDGQWPRRTQSSGDVSETKVSMPRAILGFSSLQQLADPNISDPNSMQQPPDSNLLDFNPLKQSVDYKFLQQLSTFNARGSNPLKQSSSSKHVDIVPQITKLRVTAQAAQATSQPRPRKSVQNKSAMLGAAFVKRPMEGRKSVVQSLVSSSSMSVKRSEALTSQHHAEVVKLVREIQPEMQVSAQDVALLQNHVDRFVHHVMRIAQSMSLKGNRKMIHASDVDEAFCNVIAKLSPYEFTSPLACHVLRAEVGMAYSQGVAHDVLDGVMSPMSARVAPAVATAVLNFLCIVVPRAAELFDVEAALSSFWASGH